MKFPKKFIILNLLISNIGFAGLIKHNDYDTIDDDYDVPTRCIIYDFRKTLDTPKSEIGDFERLPMKVKGEPVSLNRISYYINTANNRNINLEFHNIWNKQHYKFIRKVLDDNKNIHHGLGRELNIRFHYMADCDTDDIRNNLERTLQNIRDDNERNQERNHQLVYERNQRFRDLIDTDGAGRAYILRDGGYISGSDED